MLKSFFLLFVERYIIINLNTDKKFTRKTGDFMKIKEDFVLRKVADSYVVVPVNKLTLDFNGIINLNETGAFLFEKLQNDCEKADLLSAMLDEYEVSEQKASADIDSFIKKLREADVLE